MRVVKAILLLCFCSEISFADQPYIPPPIFRNPSIKRNIEPNYKRTIEEFKKSVSIDTVAKVLNYTDGLPDLGSSSAFWYAYDSKKCIYRKANEINVSENLDDAPIFDVNEKAEELNLNLFDPTSVKYDSYKLEYKFPHRIVNVINVYADGRTIFKTEGIDSQRLVKGWALIYTKYCSGSKKEF